MIEKEFIQQARQTNLACYLLSINEPLVKNGHRYKHKEHDSLVFTENSYFGNSRQEHGNAVDYLTRHKNMSFSEAVTALIGFAPSVKPELTIQLKDLNVSNDYKRAIAYLHKTSIIASLET